MGVTTSRIGEWVRASSPILTSRRLADKSVSAVDALVMLVMLGCFECDILRNRLGVVAAVDTPRESETRVDMVEKDFLDEESSSFLSFLNNWLLVLLRPLTKLF